MAPFKNVRLSWASSNSNHEERVQSLPSRQPDRFSRNSFRWSLSLKKGLSAAEQKRDTDSEPFIAMNNIPNQAKRVGGGEAQSPSLHEPAESKSRWRRRIARVTGSRTSSKHATCSTANSSDSSPLERAGDSKQKHASPNGNITSISSRHDPLASIQETSVSRVNKSP